MYSLATFPATLFASAQSADPRAAVDTSHDIGRDHLQRFEKEVRTVGPE